LFIGADPNTDWLSGSGVALDAKGFVLAGGDCNETRNPLETSRRGIFAIGDVRSGSIKRVAAAVGEGAQVVATLHATLAAMDSKIPGEPAAHRDGWPSVFNEGVARRTRACTHKIAIVWRSRLMSALRPKADIERHDWHVRFVPKAD
jgi:hypothetical protein